MSTLVFRGTNADAALHLVTKTCLYTNPAVVYLTLPDDAMPETTMHVELPDEWRWSSGEIVLLGLLHALSTKRHLFQLQQLVVLDEDTRAAAYEAIGVAAGLVAGVTA